LLTITAKKKVFPMSSAAPNPPVPADVLRENLVQQATTFLNDPKVASSPLAKKLAFLETKGLTQPEIQEAVKRSTSDVAVPPPVPPPVYQQVNGQQMVRVFPLWKDAFIGIVGLTGLSFGIYSICRVIL
jgi:peroxin-14